MGDIFVKNFFNCLYIYKKIIFYLKLYIVLKFFYFIQALHVNPSRPDPGQREKTNLNFYFHKFLWCLKRFHEGLIGVNFHFNTIF